MPKDKFADFDKALGPLSQRTTETTARSGRVFVLRELNGAELLTVDRMVNFAKDFSPIDVSYRRVLAAIVSVNGVEVPALDNEADLKGLFYRVHGSEIEDCGNAYREAFDVSGEDLKNESTATEDSPESPTPSSPASRTRKRSSSPTES